MTGQSPDMSDEHMQAVRKSIEAEYPGCGVAIVVMDGPSHWMVSNMARPVLAGHFEHIAMHLRNICRQCGERR